MEQQAIPQSQLTACRNRPVTGALLRLLEVVDPEGVRREQAVGAGVPPGRVAEVLRVVITEGKGGTYFAFIDMKAGGRRISIDSRPSDAVALALRMKSPIYVKPVVMEHGFHMRRDYKHPEKLGLVLQKLTPALARFFGGGEASGLLVSSVREGAPAARAGIRRGDIIFEAGGKKIETVDFFERIFLENPLEIEVSIRRGPVGKKWRLKLEEGK